MVTKMMSYDIMRTNESRLQAFPALIASRLEPVRRLVAMSESYHALRRSRKTCHHTLVQSGIYEIRHIASGRIYIGSAVCFSCRWSGHKGALVANRHHNRYLQAAWNKYGADAFSACLIEPCPIPLLIGREQYWLDTTGCTNPSIGFNMALRAESMLGFHFSEAGRENLSRAKSNPSEHTRELIRQANLGKKRPEEDCIRISKNHRVNKLSLEQIREIQQRYEESGHSITQTQLAREYGVAPRTISSIVRRKGRKYQTDIPLTGLPTRKGGISRKKHSEATKRKMSQTRLGMKRSDAARHNMSLAAKDKPKSEKHKESLRLAWQKRKERKNG
jgi:group I intron endonuclease